MPPEFLSNEEIVIAARKRLEQGPWDYLVGGSESETSLRRNRLAFDRVAFRPRVLRDVSQIDTSTTFLGHKLRIPVLLAPIGSLQAFDPGGGATVPIDNPELNETMINPSSAAVAYTSVSRTATFATSPRPTSS